MENLMPSVEESVSQELNRSGQTVCPYLSSFSPGYRVRNCLVEKRVFYSVFYIHIYTRQFGEIAQASPFFVTKNAVPSGWTRTLRPPRTEEDVEEGEGAPI